MLHFDPQEIEAQVGDLRRRLDAAGGDQSAEYRLPCAQFLLNGTFPRECAHIGCGLAARLDLNGTANGGAHRNIGMLHWHAVKAK
jgi:hypothetical protein